MSFLFPNFLFASFLIAIPIVIHLFHFRRFKKVYFSNNAFVQAIKKEKRTKSKLKNLLILLFRILAILALVVAFSQPYIPNPNTTIKSGKKSISIYVDNSYSMNNLTSNGNLLEEAKTIASELIKSYDDNDEFQIITNELSMVQSRYFTKQQSLEYLEKIKVSSSPKKLSTVYNRIKGNFSSNSSQNNLTYLISDFQKSMFDFDKTVFDSSASNYLIPVKASKYNNLYIDSAWFDKPILQFNQPINLTVRIVNSTDRNIESLSIYFKLNNKQKGISTFNIDENEIKEVQISFTLTESGWNSGVIELEDFPLTFDDKYYLSFDVKKFINILELHANNSDNYITKVFQTDPYFIHKKEDISNINTSDFLKYEMIVLNELDVISSGVIIDLVKFINNGGNVLVIPPSKQNSSFKSYNKLLNQLGLNEFKTNILENRSASFINLEHSFFKNLFESSNFSLPTSLKSYYRDNAKFSKETVLIGFDKLTPMLSYSQIGKGNCFVLTSPLNSNWTNFMNNSLFVISMYQMALFQFDHSAISHTLNTSDVIAINVNSSNSLFTATINEYEFIPSQDYFGNILNISINEDFNQAGFYKIQGENMNKTPILAFNYNRSESKIEGFSTQELNQIGITKGFKVLSKNSKAKSGYSFGNESNSSLWKLFLMLALLFLISEIIIIRVWK